MLPGSFFQQIIVRGIVTGSIASGGGNGDRSIIIDRCHEDGSFAGELLLKKEVGQDGRERLEESGAIWNLLGGSKGSGESALGGREGWGSR